MIRLVIFFAILLIFGCKQNQNSPKPINNNVKVENSTSAKENTLESLYNYVGKNPVEFGFFDNFGLTPRIKAILKDGYNDFTLDFKNPSVLKRDGDLLYMSGCQEINCNDNFYFIVIDPKTDDINVHHFQGKRGLSFEEKAIIAFPDAMSAELEKLKHAK
ncbi:MAG: hypothetical protein R2774_05790 [Saprospiraceae bacterium]